jgi:hypothetical protein
VAAVIIIADGGIAANDILAIDFGRDGDVLSNRKAEDILHMGEFEPIPERGFE